jgi:O-antigen/teichoic acid export membrane protein
MGTGVADAADAVIQAVPKDRPEAPAAVRTATVITTVGVLQISVLVIMLLRSKALALLLKPEGIGLVSTLDQLVQFVAQLSALSLIPTPTRFIARATNDGLTAVNTMYSALLRLLLVSTFGGALIAGAFLAVRPIAHAAGLSSYQSVAMIAVLSAPVFALSGFFANVAAAVRGYSVTSLYMLFAAFASLTAALIGIAIGGVAGLYYGNLIAGAVGVIVLARYLARTAGLRFRVRSVRLRDMVRQHPDLLAYCSTTYVLSFAQPLAFLIVRTFMLKRLGPADTGLFQAGFTVSSIASLVLLQAIRVYLEPVVNTAVDSRAKIAAANEFQRIFTAVMLLGMLPVVLFPREAIAMLFTRAFTPVSSVVFIFVLADLLLLCNQIYASVVMAVDDFNGYFQAHLAGHVCLCVCVWLFTDRYGFAGVAGSFFASRLVVLAWIQYVLHRRHDLRMSSRSAGIVGYAVLAVVAVALVFGSDSVPGVASATLRLLAFATIIIGTVVFLTADERLWLGSAWRRVRQYSFAGVNRT